MSKVINKTKKRLTRKEYEKRLDMLCSLFVRFADSYLKRGEWHNTCFTCGKELRAADLDCGHFCGRANRILRWDSRNMRPQCTACNRYLDGNYKEYTLRLIDDLGDDVVRELIGIEREWKTGKLKPPTIPELRTLYASWLSDAREIERIKKITRIPKKWSEND